MKASRAFVRDVVPMVLIGVIAAVALIKVAPGFRPKHIRDNIVYYFTPRGLGDLLFLATVATLIPAAYRLKRLGASITTLGAMFVIFGGLLTADLVVEVVFGSSVASNWVVRGGFVAVAAWGFGGKNLREFGRALRDKSKRLISDLGAWYWKTLAFLSLFFLLREQLHFNQTRGPLSMDEIHWWFTGAKSIAEEGLLQTMQLHKYTPAIAWLIALPNQLLGTLHDDWMYGYTTFMIVSFTWLVVELSNSGRALLAGLVTLLLTFVLSRDLAAIFFGTLYGESIATVLLALLLADVFGGWWPGTLSRNTRPLRRVIGGGLLLAFCMMSKPPLATLCLPLMLLGVAFLLSRQWVWKRRVGYAAAFVTASILGYQTWKYGLTVLLGKTTEYAISVEWFKKAGFHPDVPLGMIANLGIVGSFQFAFTAAMLCAFALVASQRAGRLLVLMAGTVLIYWGFVFGLYATLWAKGDLASAGRYISHAAIACILVLPLAFSRHHEV